MTAMRKDIAATVATAAAVLAYLTTHEGWNVWLIGDDHRWAAVAIILFGIATLVLDRWQGVAFMRLAVFAGLFSVLALISGELTPLSLLVAMIVLVWAVDTVRDAWSGTHHPTTA